MRTKTENLWEAPLRRTATNALETPRSLPKPSQQTKLLNIFYLGSRIYRMKISKTANVVEQAHTIETEPLFEKNSIVHQADRESLHARIVRVRRESTPLCSAQFQV
jgi:hypothetical protein